MKKVFEHLDFSIAGLVQGMLEREGIPAIIKNEGIRNAAGSIPINEAYLEIWVQNDDDETRAEDLIREFRETPPDQPSPPDWVCPSCGERVEGVFGECWNCETPAPAPAG